jgi:hypothetical protein
MADEKMNRKLVDTQGIHLEFRAEHVRSLVIMRPDELQAIWRQQKHLHPIGRILALQELTATGYFGDSTDTFINWSLKHGFDTVRGSWPPADPWQNEILMGSGHFCTGMILNVDKPDGTVVLMESVH